MKYVLLLILCLFMLAGCGGGGHIPSDWPQGTYVGTVHDSEFGDVSCELTITGKTLTGHFGGEKNDPYYSVITKSDTLNFYYFAGSKVTIADGIKFTCEGKDTAGLPDYMKDYVMFFGTIESFEDGHISLSISREHETEYGYTLAHVSGDLFPK
ncbi:MAG: hypothetical protein ACYC0V_14350 [Armatimonadota bacterium]